MTQKSNRNGGKIRTEMVEKLEQKMPKIFINAEQVYTQFCVYTTYIYVNGSVIICTQ